MIELLAVAIAVLPVAAVAAPLLRRATAESESGGELRARRARHEFVIATSGSRE